MQAIRVTRPSSEPSRSEGQVRPSQCSVVGFTSADANHVIYRGNEDFAVTDLTGVGRTLNGLDDLCRPVRQRQRPRS
jgi:hypothetical protein